MLYTSRRKHEGQEKKLSVIGCNSPHVILELPQEKRDENFMKRLRVVVIEKENEA